MMKDFLVPFFAKFKIIKERDGLIINEKDGLKLIPNPSKSILPQEDYIKTLHYKVTKLIEMTGKKFVFDEGLTRHKKYNFPKGCMNITTLAIQNGYTVNNGMGLDDSGVLYLAKKHGYVVITRDKGFILMALSKNEDIVYRDTLSQIHYIKGSETITL